MGAQGIRIGSQGSTGNRGCKDSSRSAQRDESLPAWILAQPSRFLALDFSGKQESNAPGNPGSASFSPKSNGARRQRRTPKSRGSPLAIELIVRPGVDSAFLAWRAPFMAGCRGFALTRRVKRAAGSATSPNTVRGPDQGGFVEGIVATWVGFANGPTFAAGTRKPSTEWPIQKYLWSDFMVNPGDEGIVPGKGDGRLCGRATSSTSGSAGTQREGDRAEGVLSREVSRAGMRLVLEPKCEPSRPEAGRFSVALATY
jgi:hypothetical protein